uniref:SAM-dependent chlorinase/fluorinase n=1 Tax=Geoglobus ahangari TaxID=113653 RepID=A0A7C4W417_9EURY
MVIALLTDFGDYYPGVMKGVIRKFTDAEVIDITHSVTPQNVIEGAFLLYNAYRFFPKDTIFVVVVDPGVGSERKALVIKTKNYYFVCPDNGIAYPSAEEDGIVKIYQIDENISELTGELSATFHGRDIFAPAAALLSKGNYTYFKEINEIKELNLFDVDISDTEIRCNVIYIDRFGNVVTNIKDTVINNKKIKKVYFEELEIPVVRAYSDVGIGEPLALIGSFKTLELSIREGNFAREFRVKHGMLRLRWKK